jgi:flagellar hook-length control protein FliK
MLRRLHLEEASRALRLQAPGKEGENQENQGESELALEFSRLLDQVQGPIAAAHDEVMALGMALAQAIPLVQQAKQGVQDRDAGDQSQESQQDFEEQALDVTVDDGNASDSGPRLVLDSRDDGAVQTADRNQADSSATTGDGVQQDEGSAEREVTAALDLGPALISEGEEDSDLAAGARQSDSNAEVIAVEEAESQVVLKQLSDSGALDQQQLEHQDAEVVAVIQKAAVIDRHEDSSNDESEDGLDAEGDFTSSSEVMLNADDVQVRQAKSNNAKNAKESAENTENAGAAQMAQSKAGQEVARSEERDLKAMPGEGRPALEQRLQRQRESASKLVQAIKVETDSAGSGVSPESPRAASANFDAAFQMTLLRQAFETLRLQRADGLDSKQRQSSSQVSVVGTVAEAKTASTDTGDRSAKQLTRPQLRRMLDRVESTLKEAARSRDGKTISLRLDPVQLGRVKVDVSLREGTLHARITPENQQVLVALREHSHELQSALRKLGLNVDSVTVTVSSETGQELSDFGRELNNGKSFQEERNNMPNDGRQVAENTIGNELAKHDAVGTKSADLADSDHWVA